VSQLKSPQNEARLSLFAAAEKSVLAKERYVNTTSLEEQLRPTTAEGAPEALVPARLLRGSWLVEQADKRHELLQRQEPFQHLPHRKQLEKEQPTAFLDPDEVETVLAEVAAAAKTGTAIMSYPPILVLSYAWKGNEHPDPDGAFLADLAPLLEWYLSERASMQKRGAVDSREIGLFMDFWSLHQRGNGVERTKWEDAVFKGALESMDVWYGHAGTVSLLMSRIPAALGRGGGRPQVRGPRLVLFRTERVLARQGRHACPRRRLL